MISLPDKQSPLVSIALPVPITCSRDYLRVALGLKHQGLNNEVRIDRCLSALFDHGKRWRCHRPQWRHRLEWMSPRHEDRWLPLPLVSREPMKLLCALCFVAVFVPGVSFAQTFNGYDCTQDCSGHQAGYDWAASKGIESASDCGGNSNSFIEGCQSYVEQNADPSEDGDTN